MHYKRKRIFHNVYFKKFITCLYLLETETYAGKIVDAVSVKSSVWKFIGILFCKIITKLLKAARYNAPVIKNIIYTHIKYQEMPFLQ